MAVAVVAVDGDSVVAEGDGREGEDGNNKPEHKI